MTSTAACLPEKAIEVLEAIKLFLDLPDCVFLLGLDENVIARGVEIRYKDFEKKADGESGANPISGAQYLEKIIQLPFSIPPIDRDKMTGFVRGLADWTGKEACASLFAEGLSDNPRQVKRTVNTFMMLWTLTAKRGLKIIKPVRLAKLVAIQNVAPRFYDLLKTNHTLLKDVEDYYTAEEVKSKAIGAESLSEGKRAARPDTAGAQLPQDLLTLLGKTPAIRRILKRSDAPDANFKEIPYAGLEAYFTLTRRAEAPHVSPPESLRPIFEPQVISIPAGKFLMGSTPEQAKKVLSETGNAKDWMEWLEWEQPQHEVELSEYFIGKYPVTNQQYQEYVREGGKAPPGWDGSEYPQGRHSHPVVNVSWNDAMAYCKWLSGKTGKTYTLPTEAQWEKAARWKLPPSGAGQGGGEALVYPWGNAFEENKANTLELNLNDTSPVGQFSPAGDSPYGCADMAGNVWEWCLDWHDEKEYKNRTPGIKDPGGPKHETGLHVLRGGSFYSLRRDTRCAYRFRSNPINFLRYLGFRVVVSPIFIESEL